MDKDDIVKTHCKVSVPPLPPATARRSISSKKKAEEAEAEAANDDLRFSTTSSSSCPCSSPLLPHLHGHLRFGNNLNDEWFSFFLLFHISRCFPSLSLRVWDSDGEFLLIEAALHLPRWLNLDTADHRVFIHNGDLHIIPKHRLQNPTLLDSLKSLIDFGSESKAPESVQRAVKN
ncbi:hypothetical protein RIF29_19287 [Crotalaria pallida]|uniref:Uncharacterized protein n=1 Tax=Crotalaria pallida TaxID=3830 RepID=A0AAN9F339_CROPI